MSKLFRFLCRYPIFLGVIISILMYFLTFTFVVPLIFGIYFCAIIEFFIKVFLENSTNKIIAEYVIYFSLFALLITLIINSIIYKRNTSKKIFLINIFIQIGFIETICFYWYWGKFLDYRNDGQLIFTIVDSFQYAHYIFLPFYFFQQLFYFIPFNKLFIKNSKNDIKYHKKFQHKVYMLSVSYEDYTNDLLEEIVSSKEGWTNEAKSAAQLILDKRKIN